MTKPLIEGVMGFAGFLNVFNSAEHYSIFWNYLLFFVKIYVIQSVVYSFKGGL